MVPESLLNDRYHASVLITQNPHSAQSYTLMPKRCLVCLPASSRAVTVMQGKMQGPCSLEKLIFWLNLLKDDKDYHEEYEQFKKVYVWTVSAQTMLIDPVSCPLQTYLLFICSNQYLSISMLCRVACSAVVGLQHAFCVRALQNCLVSLGMPPRCLLTSCMHA